MIAYVQLHHVSINVTDLEKAKLFYGEVLGLREIDRPDLGFPGTWYEIGGTKQQIHLLQVPKSQTLRENQEINTREGHFAFRINNYYETIQYLHDKGVEIITRPDSKTGFAQIYCSDPDGNIIEFNQNQHEL
jgi:catechol 2,3-dioxygenase-like lactoylglutathione lyase family enzyme